MLLFFFFKQKTAYEMRISDWSSDVCSSDLRIHCAGTEVCRTQDADRMSIVEFKNVVKRFGSSVVLNGVDINIEQGEVVVVVGPSGSGKSTFLRCINALETIEGGDIVVNGLSVLGSGPTVRELRREAGMVFQQFNLFHQSTALDNVMFGPVHTRGASRK